MKLLSQTFARYSLLLASLGILSTISILAESPKKDSVIRVFIFAGQSNMVGSDSKARDVQRFPRYLGLEKPQSGIRFSYSIGRQNKMLSEGWTDLQPVNNVIGPELSFGQKVTRSTKAPVAIIKCAAGGTHLGGDWNPDDPIGFKMYPLALDLVRDSLAKLDKQNKKYRIEGFMWHQGENDMFNKDYMPNYGKNLKNFIAKWRADLDAPELKFYLGELCTKTIWGMDLRPRMYAISQGQKEVSRADPLVEYVPTSHVGVEIGNPVGLHYHYGTLGQLQHGENYADAYLRTIDKLKVPVRKLKKWPYAKGEKVKLFVLAGHRNMEGERGFVQDLKKIKGRGDLLKDNHSIAYKYSLGGGYKKSDGWEPFGIVDYYDTFGPELSLASALQAKLSGSLAIAKFTHSGSQIIDWTPEGSMAKDRHLYPDFLSFVKKSIEELEAKGNEVELSGIFYHVGENDMSFHPYRKDAVGRIKDIVEQSRRDLGLPKLRWFLSQQPPTDVERLNSLDIMGDVAKLANADPDIIHVKALDLPPQEKRLVIRADGILALGELIAQVYLEGK
jgi:hypothetical protein